MKYDSEAIERKWQIAWSKSDFAAWRANDFDRKKKFYILDMFPYPSGDGLHVGHIEGYTATDIYARWLRRRGFNVLHPIGWDAFGLPAENYALKTKTHPAKVVEKNVARFKKQLQSIGFSYDWRREVNTTDPRYYRWTQWIFVQLFKRGLAYRTESPINWCPSCKTGLANEEVVAGECERCSAKVEKKLLPQWVLKITTYADRLLRDLETLDWPENVKEMQRNWIGRSEGYEIEFKVVGQKRRITVFTTRIDTLFGATFLVLAPEHPLAVELVSAAERKKVEAYCSEVLKRSDNDRLLDARAKTGVFTGVYAINPATREKIPIWVSEYVLAGYGTGAIMGVPAHDLRDFDFSRAFNLQIREVISPANNHHNIAQGPYEGEGTLINSGPFSRMSSKSAEERIAAYVAGRPAARYKLRDWIFSRQRYWGEPIPLIFCENCKKSAENPDLKQARGKISPGEILNPGWMPIPEEKLPLKLPLVKSYEPTGTGESPLAAITDWVNTKCPRCGNPAKRETNTMPQWAGSCWYYIGYLIAENFRSKTQISKQIQNPKFQRKLKYWLPIDLYVGGVEHAVLHLLYARFWHKVLYDIGAVSTKEPFQKLVNQGLILGTDGEKMSKSRGNVVNPDDIIKQYGADSLRLYEMFMGPLEQVKPWDTQGIVGMYRFLNRVLELVTRNSKVSAEGGPNSDGKSQKSKSIPKTKISPKARAAAMNDVKRVMHKTIKKVTEDIAEMRFNTAISALMEFQNALSFNAHLLPKKSFEAAVLTLLSLLAPFAPHITEELWHQVADKRETKRGPARKSHASIHAQEWPKYDPKYLKEETATYIIQVNGKIRDTLKAKPDASEEDILRLAKKKPKVSKWISAKPIKRAVFVKNKLVNFVIG